MVILIKYTNVRRHRKKWNTDRYSVMTGVVASNDSATSVI